MIITTFQRAHLLGMSLQRLTQLTLPERLIVINDGGGDSETEEVVGQFADRLPIEYVYHHNPGHSICSQARNVGVKMADTEFVVTSEPELIYQTDVLQQFSELQPDHPEQVISAGHVYFAQGGYDPGEDWQPPQGVQEAVGWVAPYTALYRREWLLEIGGWDEAFPGPWGWDDTDLLTRLRFSGYGQHIAREVRVIHQDHGGSMGDKGGQNERHFLSKGFHQDQASDLVANAGQDWGQIRER